jgi:hypothetical protein
MAALSIVEHLDVVKPIGPGYLPISILNPDNPISLESSPEAFHHGIVAAVAGTVIGNQTGLMQSCLVDFSARIRYLPICSD